MIETIINGSPDSLRVMHEIESGTFTMTTL